MSNEFKLNTRQIVEATNFCDLIGNIAHSSKVIARGIITGDRITIVDTDVSADGVPFGLLCQARLLHERVRVYADVVRDREESLRCVTMDFMDFVTDSESIDDLVEYGFFILHGRKICNNIPTQSESDAMVPHAIWDESIKHALRDAATNAYKQTKRDAVETVIRDIGDKINDYVRETKSR